MLPSLDFSPPRRETRSSARGGGGDGRAVSASVTEIPLSLQPAYIALLGWGSNHELACTTTASKRSRKKTFAQLKEEESSLLNEKVYLDKEITKLRAAFKDHSEVNESLKKIKVDHSSHYAMIANTDGSTRPALSPPQQRTSSLMTHSSRDESKATSGNRSGGFLLPDLNSPAMEEDFYH